MKRVERAFVDAQRSKVFSNHVPKSLWSHFAARHFQHHGVHRVIFLPKVIFERCKKLLEVPFLLHGQLVNLIAIDGLILVARE